MATTKSMTQAEAAAFLAKQGIVLEQGIVVKAVSGISKKTSKPYDGFQIKVGDAYPVYLSKGATAALASDAGIKALREAVGQ